MRNTSVEARDDVRFTIGLGTDRPRMAGLVSGRWGNRNTRLSHTLRIKSAQWESNPHFRHGKAVGCHYIMGACLAAELSKIKEHREGIEPSSPRYEGGVLPLDDQCLLSVGPQGLEP